MEVSKRAPSRCLIIGCTTRKATADPRYEIPALQLYEGPRFKVFNKWMKAASYDELEDLDVWAFSAKYGLFPAWDEIRAYNTYLTPDTVRQLFPRLETQVQGMFEGREYGEVFVGMGLDYKRVLIPVLRKYCGDSGIVIPSNWDGYGLTELRAWLREAASPSSS